MRKFVIPFGFAVFTFSLQTASAQNTSPYWSLAGNSNATTSSKLGTTNTIDLRLFTNNVERARILASNGYVGIGTTAPNARLHINSATGTSPLRAQVAGNTKLYVASNGGTALGANVTPPANGLYVSGKVGLGTTAPTARLHIVGSNPSVTALQLTSGGVHITNDWSTGDTYIGLYSEGGVGVYGSGMTGVQGDGMTGVYGTGYDGVSGQGGNAGVTGYGDNYGVFGAPNDGTGGYAAYFDGPVYSATSFTGSDSKLKTNIAELPDALAIIGKLLPKSYEFRQDGSFKLMNLPGGKHYGLIAQDVEQVLPTLVKDTKFNTQMAPRPQAKSADGKVLAPAAAQQPAEVIEFKAVNYTELIPIIVKGMQELDGKTQQIAALQKKNVQLESQLNELRQMVLDLKQGAAGALTSNGAYLEQNTPNPVTSNTTIHYYVPEQAASAKLIMTNVKGQVLKAITLNRGKGQLDVNTSLFASGTYSYTLYIDGKQADSKRFVVAR